MMKRERGRRADQACHEPIARGTDVGGVPP